MLVVDVDGKSNLFTEYHMMRWHSMGTENKYTVFYSKMLEVANTEWYLQKYLGYDIDYGNVVTHIKLFDGKDSCDLSNRDRLYGIMKNSKWMSHHDIPTVLSQIGVHSVTDRDSIEYIKQDSGLCLLSQEKSQKIRQFRQSRNLPNWL